MTPLPRPDLTIRSDVAWVEIDGDIVVYDPAGPTTHILSGGAAIVWVELADRHAIHADTLIRRVAHRVGSKAQHLRTEVLGILEQLESIGLIEDPIADSAEA